MDLIYTKLIGMIKHLHNVKFEPKSQTVKNIISSKMSVKFVKIISYLEKINVLI